ncbi:unnamed protein product [Leptidea sinapis]|uniref:Uncharacterized protein n=1 Tax=Leptidea sinapis TaxID=189913 RepID=A0A5E4PMI5_9NEOP|nr:unnamed protein product [Leptidea sinapis]
MADDILIIHFNDSQFTSSKRTGRSSIGTPPTRSTDDLVKIAGVPIVEQIFGGGLCPSVVVFQLIMMMIMSFIQVVVDSYCSNPKPEFSTAVKALHHLNPLVLFSGDAFSPSMYRSSWRSLGEAFVQQWTSSG